ncbi:type II/IV secretion system protein (plasmid) [Paenibacillus larvae subsp. larvae]|uniref:Type II/IV secretion system protein n=1 Tax=Paenibacillus larvae subsp. larvae TaxID=147375 RepID=A0A2L1UKE8_9BACL|nr:ATPase, T2SS/T4P/T4SS family [Paenibacillus larvae]AQT87057.1 hypothetical protein B1222_23810 [Paenibacillus larvae subsp. pulvifaciens]AQZ49374.1 hypothetical protein B5S25_23000 [Paenibacillus larvae subsp. pulvifaciens]AVF29020.1 type II/IV secretion system protein [Paenibacillus larvae subsp. larvae]AVF33401.1 type II/IV secretion system protein [Paenibacillus larvae subsp. larvae]MBH0342415.1 hypothetical protein [Paenibacillus larvae]
MIIESNRNTVGVFRQFATQALNTNEGGSQTSDNIKKIQVLIERRRREQYGEKNLSREVLIQWIKEEINKDHKLLVEGYEIGSLAELYADAYDGYGILQEFIRDKRWSDIKCNKYNDIVTKGPEGWVLQDVCFDSEKDYKDFVQSVFTKNGATVNDNQPLGNCIDKDKKLRINASLSDINPLGPFLVIRKQMGYQLTEEEILGKNTLNEEILSFLKIFVLLEISFLFYGEQNTAKTTTLGFTLDLIPESIAITILEDTPEITLRRKNWNSHVTRPYVGESFKPVDLKDLVTNFFRESGQWLCVGEVRGDEAYYLLRAASGGNPTCLSVHAPSPELAFNRLVFLASDSTHMDTDTLKFYFATYYKMLIGMTTEGGTKRINRLSLESDQAGCYVDIFEWIPGGEWKRNEYPEWFKKKAKSLADSGKVSQDLLKKAKVIE